MIRISIRVAAVAVIAAAGLPSLAGTADASPARPVPTGTRAPTGNPLYTAGAFTSSACPEPGRRAGDRRTFRTYLDALFGCLNRAWSEEFERAGLRFSPPRARYISKSVETGCGRYATSYAAGMYCPANATMWILLSEEELSDPTGFGLFMVVAHEYAHYAQDRAGILAEYARRRAKTGAKRAYDLDRRVELQAECFSGAFVRSVWRSLGRDRRDWEDQLRRIAGDRWHGTARNIRYWLRRGWSGGGPQACDTFRAPASRTA